eukprot:jgi/Chrpa1/931/Chrysochromulina_OHIO_Genome00013918-RA
MRLVSCFSTCFSCGHRQPIRALASAASSAAAAPLDLERVASIIASDECRNVVVMVGAGCSTSAGIPDFRTPGTGLYDNLASYGLPYPEAIFDIDFFVHNPKPFQRLCKELWPGNFAPTPTHHFLALLHTHGKLRRVLTQNIDSLEVEAGLPADRVVAAHGNFDGAHVVGRSTSVPVDEVRRAALSSSPDAWASLNRRYGGHVKPSIVFFGEQLPERFFDSAHDDLPRADLLLVMGTSLKVQPFAGLVTRAPLRAPRLLVNRERVGQVHTLGLGGFIFDEGACASVSVPGGGLVVRDGHVAGDTDAAGVMQTFVGQDGPRTLMTLKMTEQVGRDVRDFSLYPGENEILYPPNLCFEIVDSFDAGHGLIMVQCQQTETIDGILDLASSATEAEEVGWLQHMFGAPSQRSVEAAAEKTAAEKAAVEKAELDEAVNMGSISTLIKFVKSGTDAGKERAAVALSSLAVNADNQIAIATKGGIEPLVTLVKSGTDAGREQAAGALWYLARNADNQIAIATKGGIAPLIALVKSGTDAGKEHAAAALSNLANNADNQTAIATKGGIEPLIALVKSGTDAGKEHAAAALWNLADNADNQIAIATKGGIEPLIALVKSGTDAGKEKAAGALWNLTVNAGNNIAIATKGGIEPLIALVKSGTDAGREHAAGALWSLAVNAGNQTAIATKGGLEPLIALVKSGTDAGKERAAGALWSLAVNAGNQTAIATKGGLEPLIALVKSGTDVGKERAAGALWYLATNADNQIAIATKGGLEPLIALVKSGTDAGKEKAAGALWSLANNADNKKQIRRAGYKI